MGHHVLLAPARWLDREPGISGRLETGVAAHRSLEALFLRGRHAPCVAEPAQLTGAARGAEMLEVAAEFRPVDLGTGVKQSLAAVHHLAGAPPARLHLCAVPLDRRLEARSR